MNNSQPYKRQYRQLDDDVKQKISDSTRNRPKSEEHKEHIRQAMMEQISGNQGADTWQDVRKKLR